MRNGTPSTQLALDGPRLERRGGIGPVRPIWEDVRTYSPEWYRRFRDWHLATYPDSDHVTHGNLLMLIAFGLHPTIPPAVKAADLVLLATERRDLMPQTGEPWAVLDGVEPLDGRIDVWGPEGARRLFLDVFEGCAIAEAA